MSSNTDDGLKTEPTDSRGSPEQIAAELTSFQREMLVEIATLQSRPGPCYGLAIKDQLEILYDGEVNHGRLYPNLDKLVDRGLVDKSDIDRRTHRYTLTEQGRDVLVASQDRLESALGALADTDVAGGGE